MPLRRGHIAMLVAAGFLNNLVLEGDGRRILVKGQHVEGDGAGGGLPGEGGPPRAASTPRWWPSTWTTVG